MKLRIAFIACAPLVVACNPKATDSATKALNAPLSIGYATSKPKEVFIYYANETRPDSVEQQNTDYITSLMARSDSDYVRAAGDKIKADPAAFSTAVDQDIDQLSKALCNNPKNKNYYLIAFDNDNTRKGQYLTCAPNTSLQVVASDQIAKLDASDEITSDFRYKSNPMAHKDMFALALQITKNKFSPADYGFTLVSKSHGSSERAVAIRVATRGDFIRSQKDGESLFIAALADLAKKKDKGMDDVINAQLPQQEQIIKVIQSLPDSDATKAGLLNEANAKEALLKEGLLKEGLLKENILKEAVLKEALLKEGLLKEGLLKEGLLKEGLLKEGLLKEGLLKEGLLKEGLLKEGLLASDDDLSSEDILEKSSLPAIGITKEDWFGALAALSSDDSTQQMEFETVFAESCGSDLGWDLKMDIAESDWKPNVDQLITSDAAGIESYRTVDYTTFFAALDYGKPLSSQFAAYLSRLAQK